MEGCTDELSKVNKGRNDRGKRERAEKRRSEAGEEVSSWVAVQNSADSSGEEPCIAAKVVIMRSLKVIMWNVEKNKEDINRRISEMDCLSDSVSNRGIMIWNAPCSNASCAKNRCHSIYPSSVSHNFVCSQMRSIWGKYDSLSM